MRTLLMGMRTASVAAAMVASAVRERPRQGGRASSRERNSQLPGQNSGYSRFGYTDGGTWIERAASRARCARPGRTKPADRKAQACRTAKHITIIINQNVI